VEPLHIVDFPKSFNLFVDASLHAVSAVLTQTGDDGIELPVAFSSTKLSQAQMAWSTIERETYAVLSALKKYRSWTFGTQVTVYSDHNALQYLIESAPKSENLMRWSLLTCIVSFSDGNHTNVIVGDLNCPHIDWGTHSCATNYVNAGIYCRIWFMSVC